MPGVAEERAQWMARGCLVVRRLEAQSTGYLSAVQLPPNLVFKCRVFSVAHTAMKIGMDAYPSAAPLMVSLDDRMGVGFASILWMISNDDVFVEELAWDC
ncbi:hypothetical protein HPP92_017706 [Vanilla planifolia]|uniref:Uncharacterized protein n=1 Tax=Vanilla planifolia TaxID=51239 RepID=A0A835U9S6_VANPL|nr:hypothetical protein HPP92_026436 [Vanilla planifolia]KAG0468378.1 hypothetical protein HPP92_017706 [Vanilla planifolia]